MDVLKCGLCQKTACGFWHRKFFASCKYCREERCKAFKRAKEVLFKSLDN